MNFTKDQHITLQNALDTWGEHDQKAMAIGEVGEYLTLVGKQVQGRATDSDWISEIADVMIMMEQMAKIYGYDKVQKEIDYKTNRLANKLYEYSNNMLASENNNDLTRDLSHLRKFLRNIHHFQSLQEQSNGKSTQKD